jgi:imidazole glycerol-phosphate synthase subunit HisF
MTPTPRIIPCLLLDAEQQLVKTVRFDDPVYVGDPVNVLSIFSHYEVDEILLLDIRATPDRREPPYELLERLAAECMIPLGYGGGITNADQAKRILGTGLEKVVLGSALVDDPGLATAIADTFGSQAVMAAVDAVAQPDGYGVRVAAGRRDVPSDPESWARRAEEHGCGEVLLTSIDREGTREGYDTALIRQVADAVTVPVVANGGAGSRADLAVAVREGGASAAAAGSIFVFQGKRRSVLVNFPSRDQIISLFA